MSDVGDAKKILTQGGRASKQGRVLEQTIIPAFQTRGFQCVPFGKWSKKQGQYGNELLLAHVPYTTIYGHRGYTEFLVKSARFNLNHRIECKWQQSGGSVDEKLPYLYLNCIEAIPESDIIIVAGGGGMKKGAVPWLKSVVADGHFIRAGHRRKNVQVFTLEEFLKWANLTLGA